MHIHATHRMYAQYVHIIHHTGDVDLEYEIWHVGLCDMVFCLIYLSDWAKYKSKAFPSSDM